MIQLTRGRYHQASVTTQPIRDLVHDNITCGYDVAILWLYKVTLYLFNT